MSAADLGAQDAGDLRAVDRPHDLPAASGDVRLEQQAVEVDALVAQRVAFVHADHGGGSPVTSSTCRRTPARPSGSCRSKASIPYPMRPRLFVQPDQDTPRTPPTRDTPAPATGRRCTGTGRRARRPARCRRPAGATSRWPGEVAATALAGHDDAATGRSPVCRVGRHPAHARDAVVESGREGRHLGAEEGEDAVAEVDHDHRDAERGDDASPGPVHAVEGRTRWPYLLRGCSTRTP